MEVIDTVTKYAYKIQTIIILNLAELFVESEIHSNISF